MSDDELKPFQCKMCGSCCKNFQRKPEERGPALSQQIRKTGNLYFLVEDKAMSISLFEWEVKKLKNKAEELNIDLRIVPFSMDLDKNNTPLVISYMLDHDDCPFLTNENKCRIYEDRPLLCQSYPLINPRLGEEPEYPKTFSPIFGECPNYKIPTDLTFPNITEAFTLTAKNFGDSFYASLRFEAASKFLGYCGSILVKNNLLKTEKIPDSELLKILDKQKGLIEYILENGLLPKETIENTIKSIESDEKIKQILKDI